jgi:hypothetical protein
MTGQFGVCPVARALRLDGLNGGVAAGRACWMVGTDNSRGASGGGRPLPCHACEFYRRVLFEEQNDAQFRFTVEPA